MVKIQVDSGNTVTCCPNMSCKQWCIACMVISLLIFIGVVAIAALIAANTGKKLSLKNRGHF